MFNTSTNKYTQKTRPHMKIQYTKKVMHSSFLYELDGLDVYLSGTNYYYLSSKDFFTTQEVLLQEVL